MAVGRLHVCPPKARVDHASCTVHCTTRYNFWAARFGSAGLSKGFDIVAIPVRGREKRCSRVFPSGNFVYHSAKHIDYDGLIRHGPRLGELLQERQSDDRPCSVSPLDTLVR